MFEFFAEILFGIGGMFFDVYNADLRPEAQRTTIGCALIVFATIGLFFLWLAFR